MRVLVVGGGGREHALCWAIARSPLLTALFCAPGNPGTALVATNVAVPVEDIAGLVALAVAERVDLVVPGPEGPLVAGIADRLASVGIACCGPGAAAAALEGSKAFCKAVLDAAGVPTAKWERFSDAAAARDFVARRGAVVVKADGLAGGKGVVVAETEAEAVAAIGAFMEGGALGDAGRTVVLEERLRGPEVSVFALCDGTDALALGAARDHKRAFDGDAGPNTGGMGAVAPPPDWTEADTDAAVEMLMRPVLREMARRGTPFRGVLFAGLMRTDDGPKVIEFNVRFGDPECQALLPLLRSDVLAHLREAAAGRLVTQPEWAPEASVAVVLASRGYPGPAEAPGSAVALPGPGSEGLVFHGAIRRDADGTLRAAGGRVLTVVGQGGSVPAARRGAYACVDAIEAPGCYARRDIGVTEMLARA